MGLGGMNRRNKEKENEKNALFSILYSLLQVIVERRIYSTDSIQLHGTYIPLVYVAYVINCE